MYAQINVKQYLIQFYYCEACEIGSVNFFVMSHLSFALPGSFRCHNECHYGVLKNGQTHKPVFPSKAYVNKWRKRVRACDENRNSSRIEALQNRGRALTASRRDGAPADIIDGEPILHVVFVHPQIHWNTGNIGRTCLGLGARLHLIKPLGFSLDAKQIRRAGLDYWDHVDVRVYDNWLHFARGEMQQIGGTRYFFTKFGDECATDVEWECDGKITLVFGSEIDGFDGIRDWLDTEGQKEKLIAFPMVDNRFRSFNLSTTASMVR